MERCARRKQPCVPPVPGENASLSANIINASYHVSYAQYEQRRVRANAVLITICGPERKIQAR
jgi:hypothetical protein